MANNDLEKFLAGSGLNRVWEKVFSLVKILTGDVDVSTKGTLQKQLDDVRAIANGRKQGKIFATTDDMKTWLKNSANAGLLNIGDNLYIVEKDVPDWWISGVLTTADSSTGYFYTIEPLEGPKIDLSSYDTAISKLKGDITQLTENKANKDHKHDDIYYTKSEINTKMNENLQWSDKKSLGDNGCGISLYYRYNEGLKLVELEWDGSINQEITVGSAGYAWNGFPIDKSPKRNIYIPVTTKTNGVCIQFFPVDAQNANKFTLVTLISNVSNGYCCGKYLYSYN